MTEREINQQDQINLKPIRNFVLGIFSFFFEVLSFTKNAAKKNIWYLVIGCALGAGVGFYITINKKPLYKASMVVQFSRLTKKTYAEVLQQLNQLIQSGSVNEFAAELKIPVKLADQIKFIESTDMNGKELSTDTSTKVNQPFKIMVGLSNRIATDSLETAIMHYLNNRPYLQILSGAEKRNALERIDFINNELRKLDSLKSEFNKFLASSKVSATFYNNAINPAEVYTYSNNLIIQKEQAQRFLALDQEAILLIDGFKFMKLPESVKLFFTTFIAAISGLFIGLLIGLLIETEKKVRS